MAVEEIGRLRTIAIVGQGGTGKTQLAEAMLFTAGAITRLGRPDDGTAAMDFEPEELHRHISISSSFHHLEWKKTEVIFADTPGYNAFLPECFNTLRAVDGLVFVASPGADMKVESEKIWEAAGELGLPRIAFVSRLDRERTKLRFRADRPGEDSRRGRGAYDSDRRGAGILRRGRSAGDESAGLRRRQRQSPKSRSSPATSRPAPNRRAPSSARRSPNPTTRCSKSIWRRARSKTTNCARRCAPRCLKRVDAGPVRIRKQEHRRCARCSTRSSTLLPAPTERPPQVAHNASNGEPIECTPDPAAPLCGVGLQDRNRSFRRQALDLPRCTPARPPATATCSTPRASTRSASASCCGWRARSNRRWRSRCPARSSPSPSSRRPPPPATRYATRRRRSSCRRRRSPIR